MKKLESKGLIDKKTWRKASIHLKQKDIVLARIINGVGSITIEERPNHYQALVRSFIAQQISGSAADSILLKFKLLYNGRFPTPEEFLKTPERRIRKVGISPQKYSST